MAVTIVGTRSHSLTVSCTNGGEAFAVIAEHYLGRAGLVVLALTVILACLKTSIGLVTSCAETFTAMFPNGPKYGFWAICFMCAHIYEFTQMLHGYAPILLQY